MSDGPKRWSKATVYPDVCVDPKDDSRDGDGVSSDGELATLTSYLTNYRTTLRMKCEGLDEEQLAHRSVPPSTMSLGLLRHLAEVERDWRNWITEGDPLPKLYGEDDGDFDGAADQAVVDEAYVALAREQAATDAVRAEHAKWASTSGKLALPCENSRCIESRSTPVTVVTPTCCASASTAGWASERRGCHERVVIG